MNSSMIRFILQFILVIVLSYASQWLLPWWGVMVGAGLATILIYNKGALSFFAGFFGVGGLWFVMAYIINRDNNSILSTRVAELFQLSSGVQLVLVTALLGAILGGLSSLTGSYFIAIFKKTKKFDSPYH